MAESGSEEEESSDEEKIMPGDPHEKEKLLERRGQSLEELDASAVRCCLLFDRNASHVRTFYLLLLVTSVLVKRNSSHSCAVCDNRWSQTTTQ